MRVAIQEDLGVGGGIGTEVQAADILAVKLTTKQLDYVSQRMDKAFLCQETLMSLGALPISYPKLPCNVKQHSVELVNFLEDTQCSCPKRAPKPQPITSKLPFEAPGDNVPKLKEWLLDYYGFTAFSTCEHQLLSMMECEPL